MSAERPNPYPLTTIAAGGPHPDPADLSLYAMQLLPSAETEAIAQHLARCAECRAELARIQGDLALTALTVDLESPSAAARQRLLDQVASEKKIVPAPLAPAQPQTQNQAQTQPQLKPIAAFGRSGSSGSVLSIEDHQPKRSIGRTLFAVAGWAVAAALAVAATFLFNDRKALRDTLAARTGEVLRLNSDAASAHQLMDALTDPGAVRVTLTAQPLPKSQPIADVTYNPDKGSLVFLASNLNPLQQYKAYELLDHPHRLVRAHPRRHLSPRPSGQRLHRHARPAQGRPRQGLRHHHRTRRRLADPHHAHHHGRQLSQRSDGEGAAPTPHTSVLLKGRASAVP